MQKKVYIGGLPWELDRIGVLNYVKAIFECNDIQASYELPFITAPALNPNASVRVIDVFVAMDRATGKSRGFGFLTLDFVDDSTTSLFDKIISLLNNRVVIGIRGPRELIVNEADEQRPEGASSRESEESDMDKGSEMDMSAGESAEEVPAEGADEATDDQLF